MPGKCFLTSKCFIVVQKMINFKRNMNTDVISAQSELRVASSKLFYEGIKFRMHKVAHVSILTLANKHKTELC